MTDDDLDLPAPGSSEAAATNEEGSGTSDREPNGQEPVGLTPADSPPATELEALRQERDQLRDALLRRRAEFENFRRRTERERQGWAAEAEATLAQALIPTLDNLEQALKIEGPEGGMRAGVELIQRDLLATLGRLGLVEHEPTGQSFDPLTAQALVHEVAPDVAEGTVTETFRKGYLFKQRLLRPAIVKVAKAVLSTEEPTPSSETGSNEVDLETT
jgi:molecular chaperone GrpE